MGKIILASQSPRRKELLARLGFPFEVRPSDAEEKITEKDPEKAVEQLSLLKAGAVLSRAEEGDCVIGADTIVVLDGRILGKPKTAEHAFQMLSALSGRSHRVCTGVSILEKGGKSCTFHETTKVFVAKMTKEEIESYIRSGEPMDKAGAYGIQGAFAPFIEGIEGDYYNVVGLPLHHLYQALKDLKPRAVRKEFPE